MARIEEHPILDIPKKRKVRFTFEGRPMEGLEGEMVSSALIANGEDTFGSHQKDGAPQGMYCSNGQCSQCLVIADGFPVKGCMTPVREGMDVRGCKGKPKLPEEAIVQRGNAVETIETECLIIGGGPAGLSAALELGKQGVETVLIDDKYRLGGKLTLQTHVFFGSTDACYAGSRGIDIAERLTTEVSTYDAIDIRLATSAVGVFPDGKVGIVTDGTYYFIKPEILLVASGAREKALAFPGCDLPGVYGAGAFQTLVNRDLVKASERLFVCGGGNVGLITAYHALQAGIQVTGLAEALSVCGGYKVHADKIISAGIPVYTSHTILTAYGKERVEGLSIAEVDASFTPVKGTEKRFSVDTILIAVGLTPIDELYRQARTYGFEVFAAGDAEEISEASAAMFSGRIAGKNIVRRLTGAKLFAEMAPAEKLPEEAGEKELMEALRSKPGAINDVEQTVLPGKVYPVIRCKQEIPCDPCAAICPKGAITLDGDPLLGIPRFTGKECSNCGRCVLICPGLAISLVDERFDPDQREALITLPFEYTGNMLQPGREVVTLASDGTTTGKGIIEGVRSGGKAKRLLVSVRVPFEERLTAAGIRMQDPESAGMQFAVEDNDETIICRCERITKGEIVAMIRKGCRDLNQIKAALRTGMGACGGKTCEELILRLFAAEGVDPKSVTPFVKRPPLTEVPLKLFAGVE